MSSKSSFSSSSSSDARLPPSCLSSLYNKNTVFNTRPINIAHRGTFCALSEVNRTTCSSRIISKNQFRHFCGLNFDEMLHLQQSSCQKTISANNQNHRPTDGQSHIYRAQKQYSPADCHSGQVKKLVANPTYKKFVHVYKRKWFVEFLPSFVWLKWSLF